MGVTKSRDMAERRTIRAATAESSGGPSPGRPKLRNPHLSDGSDGDRSSSVVPPVVGAPEADSAVEREADLCPGSEPCVRASEPPDCGGIAGRPRNPRSTVPMPPAPLTPPAPPAAAGLAPGRPHPGCRRSGG